MKTLLTGTGRKVVIGDDYPTVIIGERINPSGKEKLTAALLTADFGIVCAEAREQVRAGAHVLDVNVGAADVDEVALLPQVIKAVMETVDVPISIDTIDAEALAAALVVHKKLAPTGKPLVNSINGKKARLERVLPLVAKYGAAVVGLCMDDTGIPESPEGRLAIARKIVERAEGFGVPREDVFIDPLVMTVSVESRAALVALETIRRVKQELGVNLIVGASNVSFGLPARDTINAAFITMAICNGLNCTIADAARVRPFILAADLLLGHDEYAVRFIKDFRQETE